MKVGLVIVIFAVIVIVYFILRKSNGNQPLFQVARQIQLGELESVMTQLSYGKLEYEFFGIHSNGVDCIYFSENNGKINIEFEVMSNEQKPYVEKLTSFADENGYKITKMTYGNQPLYSDLKEAPVYKIELNTNKKIATEVGIEIMKTVFHNNETTIFEVVP